MNRSIYGAVLATAAVITVTDRQIDSYLVDRALSGAEREREKGKAQPAPTFSLTRDPVPGTAWGDEGFPKKPEKNQ